MCFLFIIFQMEFTWQQHQHITRLQNDQLALNDSLAEDVVADIEDNPEYPVPQYTSAPFDYSLFQFRGNTIQAVPSPSLNAWYIHYFQFIIRIIFIHCLYI